MNTNHFKGLIVILDGLGDRPCPSLNGLTPLEYAQTPVLDKLAADNQSGLMDPLFPGFPVDTHTGVGMLFGLSAQDAKTLSRGPIEAAGINLDLLPGDVYFRANFATLEKKGPKLAIIDRRAGRIQLGTEALCRSLQNIPLDNNISASLFPATQHRCVLRLRGKGLSENVTDTDPGGKNISLGLLRSQTLNDNDPKATRTAKAINQFSEMAHETLKCHEINLERQKNNQPLANGLITRGVGKYEKFESIVNNLNVKTAVVAGESTILGLGKLFGFSTHTDQAFTSLDDTDVEKKLSVAVQLLQSHDLLYVHFKGTDTTAHDKNPHAKAHFIERIDHALGRLPLEDMVFAVCADHSTDSIRGEHNGDSVPILIQNPLGRKDTVQKYNETACSLGALVRIDAPGFLLLVLDAMGKMTNYPAKTLQSI